MNIFSLRFPRNFYLLKNQEKGNMKTIALFTSGGDAPGMNACIRSVVRSGHHFGLKVFGIYKGFEGMINGSFIEMDDRSVSNIIQKGGTILKSARSEEFSTPEGRIRAYENIKKFGIDGLVAIGGNGTLKGASLFYEEHGVPCIGVPGTIDNDLYGTDFTIGYDSAVNTALNAIDKIRDTADSHERVFFIEVMGRDTGFIGIRSAISGGAEMAILPETKATVEGVIDKLRYGTSHSRSSHIIIVAEEEGGRRAQEIALKVKQALPELDTKVTTLGHIQRGGAPTATDRVLASRLGYAAVKGLVEGRTNVMAGVINWEVAFTPFSEIISREKPLKKELIELIDILNGRHYPVS